jgi:hypothetical protein
MVTKIYCYDVKTVYIIHSPSNQPTAVELEEWLNKNKERIEELLDIKIDGIVRLNTGVEYEQKRAEEIFDNESCIDLEI